MPKRTDISSILVIGSGPIVIGQACEFDYSGTQACRVLKDEGIRVILVNSNPATIMTDPEFADATYIEPITPEFVEKVIEKERPDALLATLGGQTALNTAMSLDAAGVLEKYGVELIGASIEAIERGENRESFKRIVESLGGEVAQSVICHSIEDCVAASDELGYPMVVRPSFTMGGSGSGMAYNEADLRLIAGSGLTASPTTEVLLEESIIGWKEYELEVMRDQADNVVIICSIENLDPMGVHTGDSITVAPAMTLTDREYQHLRDLSIGIIRAVGVDTGGCNIQFAVNPADGRVVVIEMNPRVSRSSALASKATGFPIAKIAAKVAIGYTLDEITNDITRETPASFEPTLDYVVVKVPRFAFEKFPGADTTLTTHMKSVGEAMAIGRNFTEALQKALRSLESKSAVFDFTPPSGLEALDRQSSLETLLAEIAIPTDGRLKRVMDAILAGATPLEIFEATKIDPWFVDQLFLIKEVADRVAGSERLDEATLRLAKRHGFSDAQIAQIRGMREDIVRGVRQALGVRPVYKTVDTCAAEFAAATPYHYSSYDEETEVEPREREAVIILGSGPNRIGQGIEFDYSCVHASMALSEVGLRNDHGQLQSGDRVDRLRHVGPVVLRAADARGRSRDRARGVHRRARSPASSANSAGRRRWGSRRGFTMPAFGSSAPSHRRSTWPRSVGRSAGCWPRPGFRRPNTGWRRRSSRLVALRRRSGIPCWCARRTSSVAGAWRSCTTMLRWRATSSVRPRSVPIIRCSSIDSSTTRWRSMWMRCSTARSSTSAGVMEHIEEAGIHSGDSACALPPITLGTAEIARIRQATEAIARGVGVLGLINIQFALGSDVLYVLEANPRASRTVPFVSKATAVPLAKAAARVMLGESIASLRACWGADGRG